MVVAGIVYAVPDTAQHVLPDEHHPAVHASHRSNQWNPSTQSATRTNGTVASTLSSCPACSHIMQRVLPDEHHPALHAAVRADAARVLCSSRRRREDFRRNLGVVGVYRVSAHARRQRAENVA